MQKTSSPTPEMAQQTSKRPTPTKVLLIIAIIVVSFVGGTGFGFTSRNEIESRLRQGTVSRDGLPDDLNYEEVESVYDSLRTNFDGELTVDMLLDGLKDGLVRASDDPYTEYLDTEEATSFDEGLSGSFTGIGAELGKEDQFIVIVSPLNGFPAQEAGLRSGDVIAEIDGENAYDLSITEAVEKIRGPEGTTVKLTIIRDETERLDIEITREQITIPSVESEIRDDKIGYLKISRFGADTTSLVQDAAQDFVRSDVEGIVLDLRGNPGGLLDSAVQISSLWVDKDDVVLEEKQSGETIRTLRALGGSILGDIPTIVLIDEGSASASEIVAGALHDQDKATLIGETSYGKGSVQQLIDFGDGSKLKVTIARWFTPEGKNIDKEGIEPDQKVERTVEDIEADRDPQLDAAIKELQ